MGASSTSRVSRFNVSGSRKYLQTSVVSLKVLPTKISRGLIEQLYDLTLLPRMLNCSSGTGLFPLRVSLTAFKCVFIAISTPGNNKNQSCISHPNYKLYIGKVVDNQRTLMNSKLTNHCPMHHRAILELYCYCLVIQLHQKSNELHGFDGSGGCLCCWLRFCLQSTDPAKIRTTSCSALRP